MPRGKTNGLNESLVMMQYGHTTKMTVEIQDMFERCKSREKTNVQGEERLPSWRRLVAGHGTTGQTDSSAPSSFCGSPVSEDGRWVTSELFFFVVRRWLCMSSDRVVGCQSWETRTEAALL